MSLDPLRAMFDDLGIPTLCRFLDDGADWSMLFDGYDEVTRYAVVTAVRWYGTGSTTDHDSGDELAEFYGECLFRVLEGGDLVTDPDSGETTMVTTLGLVTVTERTIRHWQWLRTLLVDEEAAERFLAAVPEAVRVSALQAAGDSYDVA